MKRFWIPYPFLFALASLLFLYPNASITSSPQQLLRPLLVFWAILLLFNVLMNWVGIDRYWAAFALGTFVLGFCSSREFFNIAGLISTISILLWWLILFLRRQSVKVYQFTFMLNAISIFLVLILISWNFLFFRQVPWMDYQQALTHSRNTLIAKPTIPEIRPDIYYIVLDGYARSDILDEIYEFDNSDFIDSLKARGFLIPEQSCSNYPKTALSVTSTLNMDYISALVPGLEDSYFWWLMSPLINYSQTRMMLENIGYKIISIATDWSITDNSSTDFYLKPYPVHLNDYEGYLFGVTPLGYLSPVIRNFSYVPSFDGHRKLIDYSYETLSQIPEISGAKFTFSHIISPHPPFVFDEKGNSIEPNYSFMFADANDFPGTKEQYRNGYVGQLKYTNIRILQVVDDIIAKSKTPPIIILQADHGPGLFTDFSSSENTCLKERFSVFAAYYLPGVDAGQVPNDLSAVNVFRLILNHYFETDLPLLENRYFYYKNTILIYQAEEITSQLENTCKILK